MRSICGDLLLQRLGPSGPAALGKPLNRGIYECIRGAIQDGSLAPTTRLPPSRDLAAELGLSRNTVMFAYEQLLAEGYVHARTGSGTFVAATAPETYLNATATATAAAAAASSTAASGQPQDHCRGKRGSDVCPHVSLVLCMDFLCASGGAERRHECNESFEFITKSSRKSGQRATAFAAVSTLARKS